MPNYVVERIEELRREKEELRLSELIKGLTEEEHQWLLKYARHYMNNRPTKENKEESKDETPEQYLLENVIMLTSRMVGRCYSDVAEKIERKICIELGLFRERAEEEKIITQDDIDTFYSEVTKDLMETLCGRLCRKKLVKDDEAYETIECISYLTKKYTTEKLTKIIVEVNNGTDQFMKKNSKGFEWFEGLVEEQRKSGKSSTSLNKNV